MSDITRKTIPYRLLHTYVKSVFPSFFRQIEVRGAENVPSNVPIIFAPNHQCGLMDPLCVLFFQPDPVVFMARADIFKNEWAKRFLRFLKITPVFRIRDGYENLSKNEVQFDLAKQVLLKHKKLCIMPEGRHGNQRTLKPLVKGIFRIAFAAEEALDPGQTVHIIPVGIDYSHYEHAGADLIVQYGTPIRVCEYMDQYRDNTVQATLKLKQDLQQAISSLMLDIRTLDRYDELYNLACLSAPAYLENQVSTPTSARTLAGQLFDARKTMSIRLDKMAAEQDPRLEQWTEAFKLIQGRNLFPTQWTEILQEPVSIAMHVFQGIITLVLLPFSLLNAPAHLIARKINKAVEDKQMHTTFSFVVGLIVVPLVYMLAAIVLTNWADLGFARGLVSYGLMLIAARLAERWRQYNRLMNARFWLRFGKDSTRFQRMQSAYKKGKRSLKKRLQ